MNLEIQGKRALVCAASKGIGRGIAEALVCEGAELFVCARDENRLSQTVHDLQEKTDRPVYYQMCDLTDSNDRESLIRSVNNAFEAIDILVHNVGGPASSTVQETALGDWQQGFERLFQSVVHLNQAFLPSMIERRWGRIIAVTSLSVLEPIPDLAVSNAMRSAMTSMLKTLADEVARYNVTVNCVAPGQIQTDRTEERIQAQLARHGGERAAVLSEYARSVPAGRLGNVSEFGSVVAFLASERAAYITGSTICVDGGKRRSTY